MSPAGILLTGGGSRRMGIDKASMRLPGGGGGPRETLAERTGRLLEMVAAPAVEVGPGRSRLVAVPDTNPGAGPLAALASGVEDLHRIGWDGPVLVLATDLPHLTAPFLAWLAEHPSPRSVVPTAAGWPQTLCARYSAPDLQVARELVGAGAESMRDFLHVIDPLLADPEQWWGVADDPDLLTDVDEPKDLERLGWTAR